MEAAIVEIVHDFRNSLSIIDAIAGVLEKKIADGLSMAEILSHVKKLRGKIRDAAENINQLISHDLELDLKEELESFIKFFQESYGVTVKLSGNKKFIIKTNTDKLKEFFLTMVKNASEAGATVVNIFITSNYLIVKDNGKGFDEKMLSKINLGEPIFTKKGKQGRGLIKLGLFCLKYKLDLEISNQVVADGAQITVKKLE